MANKRNKKLVAAIATLGLAIALTGCSQDAGSIDKCEKLVSAKLRSPASAKFSEIKIHKDDPKNFNIEGSVDSKNGFGVLIRATFDCYVTDGDKVELYGLY